MARSPVAGRPGCFARALLVACSALTFTSPALAQDGALRTYYTANGLLNRGLYAEAMAEYQAFLETEPEGDEAATARYGLALCLSQLGRADEALAQLDQLEPSAKFPFAFESEFLRGQLLYGMERFEDAARTFGRLVRNAGDNPRAAEAGGLWVECLYRQGEHQEAVRRAQELASRSEGDLGRAALFAALSLEALGRTDDATETLRPLLERDDEIGRSAALSIAAAYVREGEFDEAAAQYERLAKLDDERWSPQGQLGLARVRRAQGRSPEALAILRGLQQQRPGWGSSEEATLELGINLVETGEHEPGRNTLAALASADESTVADRAQYWTAKSLLRSGDAELAVERLEAALKDFPNSPIRPEMLYDLGVALKEAGHAARAVGAFDRLPKEHPGHRLVPTAQLAAATTLLQLGRFDHALTRAQEVDPDSPDATEAALVIAEAEAMLGRHDEAIGRLRAWLKTNGNLASADRARYRLSLSLAATGELREAESTAGALLDSESVEARFRPGLLALGDAAFAEEAWERAEHWYRRAVDQGAEPFASARLKLGLALARQGRHAEAEELFALAAGANHQSDVALQALFELGQARLVAGDDGGAASAFTALLERAPDSRFAGYARQHLGGIAERAGDAEAAAVLYAAAAESGGEIRTHALRDQARASLAAGDYDAVERLATDSDDPDVQALAGIALARDGDLRGAIKRIDAVVASGDLSDEIRRSAQFERAWCQRRLGDGEASLRSLGQLLEEDVEDRFTVYASLEAASIALDSGRPDDAEPWLDQAVALMEEQPRLAEPAMESQLDYRLAQRDAAADRHEAVIERLGPFAERHPGSALAPAAALLLGDAYIGQGQAKEAVRAFEQAASNPAGPIFPVALLRLGDALGRAGEWQASREQFERYLREHADSPHAYEAHFGIGWALEHEGQHAEAREAYGRVVAEHEGPTAARAQFQIGECLFAEGQFDEAVRELLRVDILYAYPEWSAAALYEAGRAFEQLRKFGEARQQYRETIDRFPDTDWAPLARERLDRLAASGQ